MFHALKVGHFSMQEMAPTGSIFDANQQGVPLAVPGLRFPRAPVRVMISKWAASDSKGHRGSGTFGNLLALYF